MREGTFMGELPMVDSRYDYLIIGAGTAGCVLAARLSEDPSVSVCVIEAGPDYPTLESLPPKIRDGLLTSADIMPGDHEWGFTASPNADAPEMFVPRGKIVGGSSAVNGQMFLRGVPEDFDGWAAAGNPLWSFDSVLPFFVNLENDLDFSGAYHGKIGPIPVRRWARPEWLPPQEAFYAACRDAGYPDSPDHNAPDATGVGPTPLNQVDRVRWSTHVGYLMPARARRNLTVMSDTLALRVLVETGRAIGAELSHEKGISRIGAGEVILSAGPIKSPQLLMLSGIGPAAELRRFGIGVIVDLPGVGRNVRDHPNVGVLFPYADSYRVRPDLPRYQVILRYTAPGSPFRNDLQIFFTSFATRRVDRGGTGMDSLGIAFQPVLNLAVSQGVFALQSADPTVQPRLDYHLLDEEFDRARMRHAMRMCADLGDHASFRDLVSGLTTPERRVLDSDVALDRWLRREVATTHHISGTCRMGPSSDRMTVVDERGRVHGVRSLRVADASIMPDCVRANTNATVMMIGERLADIIRTVG
jgi:choline dehydrogenase